MDKARGVPLAVSAAIVAVLASTAGAATQPISGSFPRGGCGPTQSVSVGAPSRIEAGVSTTSVSGDYDVQITDAEGTVVSATGSYDTSGAGVYGVRVCSGGDPADPDVMQYSGLIGTGPPGQPALPRSGVAGAFEPAKKVFRTASGMGAIRTPIGLVWLAVHANTTGKATVRIDLPARGVHLGYTSGLRVYFGLMSVRVVGRGVRVTVLERGRIERFSIDGSRVSASGKVVRGGYTIA